MDSHSKKNSLYLLLHWRDFRLKIFLEGMIVGLFTGLLIVAFRFLLEQAETWRRQLYLYLKTGPGPHQALSILTWLLVLFAIAYILGMIVRTEPQASGSGIPQVKGILMGQMQMNWLRVIFLKFSGGVLAIGAGLSLGREGPSIQLGAAVGQGLSRFLKLLRIEEKYLLTSGASAGLAAAFNAPLAGVIFSLEELHKNFSPAVLMAATAASLTADYITQWFFGFNPVFDFSGLAILPASYYLALILLGLLTGSLGILFNKSLIFSQSLYERQTLIPKRYQIAIPLALSLPLGFFRPEVLGGGHQLITSLKEGHFGLMLLGTLLIFKFLLTMASYGSGVPGGIFLPMLVTGALIGDIYGEVLIQLHWINQEFLPNFIVFAMAAYFTAVVKAPITGSILITEMTGSFHHLLALTTVSMTAYLMSELLNSKPVYELLYDRLLAKGKPQKAPGSEAGKTITEMVVPLGSVLDGKMVREIPWPSRTLLVNIKRGEQTLIPKGDTVILAGDFLYILAPEGKSSELFKLSNRHLTD